MKHYAIIGLGNFGRGMAQEFSAIRGIELILVDRDPQKIDEWKERFKACYIADASELQTLREILPEKLHGAVVDSGDNIEASIIITHNLKKLGYGNIVVRAKSDSHAEIVRMLGAERTVFSDREAAKRIVPLMLNSGLLSFTPMGKNLAFAEVVVPQDLIGRTLLESQFRSRYELNIIAYRVDETLQTAENGEAIELKEYQSIEGGYIFREHTILLVAGTQEHLQNYAQELQKRHGKT